MRTKHRTAIELLMSYADSTVAEMLGIRLCTLRRWMRDPAFADAMRRREREQKAGANRIARQAVINAAAALCQATCDPTKPDTKVLLDVLKQSGAFEQETTDPGEALAEVIRRATLDEEAGNGPSNQ